MRRREERSGWAPKKKIEGHTNLRTLGGHNLRAGIPQSWRDETLPDGRVGLPELTNFGVATREMGLGTLRRCTTMLHNLLSSNQFPQNQNSNTLLGAGNGLARTQRIHNAGCPSGRALQVQMASINQGKKRQKDPIPTAGPIQVLTQVLQLVQSLPVDPHVKEQLQVSLRGHVEPMLPNKSTVDLVVEKETLHSQQSSALAAKKVDYDQLLAVAQAVADDMIVTLESVANLKPSCELYRPKCCSLHCPV